VWTTARSRGLPTTEMEIKCLLVKGRFTEDDWRELVQTLRQIESRHPDETFWATVIDSDTDPTSAEAVDMIKRTYPTRPGHELTFLLKRQG
jgi:hypothetical protein